MKTILLADDDKNFGAILKRELEEDNFIVDLVGDGVEAVLNFIAKAYDFLLLDLKMPRLNGIDTLKIIKKLNPDVPVIAFSGMAGDRERAQAVECGAEECLPKPFEIARLKKEIAQHLKE